jgi:signal transduction histidine kinase
MDTIGIPHFYMIVLTAVVLCAIIFYFLYSVTSYHKKFSELSRVKISAELILLENEKRRVAGDLHDELGPMLSALKLKLYALKPAATSSQPLFDDAIVFLDSIMSKIRRFSVILMPNSLLKKGPVAAIKEFIATMQEHTGTSIQFYAVDIPVIGKDHAVEIYRIIQEIVYNTVKHATAKKLSILLSYKSPYLVINTRDNGKGFDLLKVQNSLNSLGIHIMEGRVHMLQGAMDIKTAKNKGTCYYIKIPLPAHPN